MQVTRILSFSLNILCLFGIYDCNKNYRNFSENFYNLAVTSGHVYIGGNHSLIQLNSTLDEVKVIPLNGKNWLLTPYDNKIGETIIISCTFLHIEGFKVRCIGLNASELAPVDGFIGNVVTVKKLTSVKYVTTLIGTDPKVNTLTIASSGCLQNGGNIFECLAISNYQQNMNILESHTVRYLFDGNGNLDLKSDIIIDFKSVVVHRHSTYFLFRLKNTVSKLGKMCTKELHSIQQDLNNINTYEDLIIYCTDYNGVKYTIAEDMVFWNDHLLVTFNDGVGSVVCKFTDISNSFKTSRQDKLKCPYKETTNQYFQKPHFKLCYNKNNATCQSFNGQIPCHDVIGDTCKPQFFGSVEGNISMEGDAIYKTQNSGTIIKMTDVLLADNFAVLHVGTSKGSIGTILINESVAVSLGDFKTVQWFSPVIDIKKDGENVYAMTKNKVVNVANTANCIGNSCKDCMKSKNLRCGWDIINKRCNKKFNESFWVPSAGKSCMRIVADDIVVRDDIRDNLDTVEIKFKLEPAILFTILKYKKPDDQLGDVDTTGDYYKITDYEVSARDPINLEITDMDGNPIVSAKVNVYTCGNAGNCTSCVKGRECCWCPLKFQCVKNGSECGAKKIKKQEEGNCPRVDGTTKVLLAKDKTEDIEVSALKLDMFDNQKIGCLVGGIHYTANASNPSTVVCRNVKAPENPSSDLKVKLQYNHQDLDNSAELEVYDCQDFGKPDGNCGNCRYQSSLGYKCRWCGSCEHIKDNGDCSSTLNCEISVHKISPPTGPEYGGTQIQIYGRNIGNPNDDITVKLYGVICTDIEVLKPSNELQCTTGSFSAAPSKDLNISVNKEKSQSVPANKFYRYEENQSIKALSFSPNTSIIAGGKRILIKGNNIGFDDGHTYDVSFCTDINDCIKCSGGAFITLKGSGFKDVGEVRVDNVESPCTIQSDTSVRCNSPQYVTSDFESRKGSTGQNKNINFDNYQVQSTIYYVDDPIINLLTENTPNILEYEEEKAIVITGNHLLEGASEDDYNIHIGLDGNCYLQDMTNDNITCLPPKDVPCTNHSDKNTVYVMVVVGRIHRTVGHLKYILPSPGLPVYIIIISVLATALILAIGILAAMILKNRQKKTEENLQMELLSRKEHIRHASREEFADAQKTIRDMKSDLVTSRVPFFDYQSYAFHQLFPNEDMETHPILHEPMITDVNRGKVQEAMGTLDKLMNNKLFLKELVQTLDHHNKLTMKDKANFASLLSVALIGNMRLFYDSLTEELGEQLKKNDVLMLVSCLLNEMVQSASTRQYKVLFKRVESVTQRLMVNWLELTLFDHLKSQCGMQLFMLYKATQIVIEKGPIDAVTKNSRNTLAEERCLKSSVEYETLTLNVDLNGNTGQRFPVSVLSCDTITQVKQKSIIAIYKNIPASEVPPPNEFKLVWHQCIGGNLVLQDVDNSSDRNNSMLRLNTLKHYMVKDKSEMSLMYKETTDEDPNEIYEHLALPASPEHIYLQLGDSSGDQGMHIWHLSNLTNEEKSDKEHAIDELVLNRLFDTKLLLKDSIDAVFDGIMDPKCLSIPVRYFLCMIDKLSQEVGLDSDVLQSWKSECYATRVWASLISKPQILFDVNVPSHVEPCMDVLRQVFIDSFTQGTQNVSKNSSTQKLLFYKDVPERRKRVNSFFIRVEAVRDQEFWRAIDDISNVQTREIKFSRQATLHQLYSFIAKYKNEIIEDFSEKDVAQNLEFGTKLEEIIDLMEETTDPCYLTVE